MATYTDAQLRIAMGTEWECERDASLGMCAWKIFPAGERPGWDNAYRFIASGDLRFFAFEHSNENRGLWSAGHCLRQATLIYTFTLAPTGKTSLGELLASLLASTRPNRDDPT